MNGTGEPGYSVAEVRIVRRTTRYDRNVIRDKLYEFSEIFITTADGRRFYSRTWDVLPDTAHERATQAAAFQRRMKMADSVKVPEREDSGPIPLPRP